MPNIVNLIPELAGEELTSISELTRGMSDDQASTFASAYRAQRKDPSTVLLLTILGFVVVSGVQRFYLGQIGMGFLFLFTGGFCLIGTIIDVIGHKELAARYNFDIAQEIEMRVRGWR